MKSTKPVREAAAGIEKCLAAAHQEVKSRILEAASALEPFPHMNFYTERVREDVHGWRNVKVNSLDNLPLVQLPAMRVIPYDPKRRKMIKHVDPKRDISDTREYGKHVILTPEGIFLFNDVMVMCEGVKRSSRFLSLPTKAEVQELYQVVWPNALESIQYALKHKVKHCEIYEGS